MMNSSSPSSPFDSSMMIKDHDNESSLSSTNHIIGQGTSNSATEIYFLTPNTLSDGPFTSSTLTSPTNSVSILSSHSNTTNQQQFTTSSSTSSDQQQQSVERLPRTSFIAQRKEESEKPYALSPHATVLIHEYPNGPVREKLVEMVYSPLDSQQYFRFGGGRAIENMKGTLRHYGYPRELHSIVEDVELNLVYPLNRILERHQKISSHYEMYFKMLLNSLIFIAIITLGCGLVFFPCLAIIQYLHWKHVKKYDKNVKQRIGRILERENKKYLPYGFEWIAKYTIINTDKRTCVGLRNELACVQEVVLSLIHVSPNPSVKKQITSPPLSSFSSDLSIVSKETPSTTNGNPALSEENNQV